MDSITSKRVYVTEERTVELLTLTCNALERMSADLQRKELSQEITHAYEVAKRVFLKVIDKIPGLENLSLEEGNRDFTLLTQLKSANEAIKRIDSVLNQNLSLSQVTNSSSSTTSTCSQLDGSTTSSSAMEEWSFEPEPAISPGLATSSVDSPRPTWKSSKDTETGHATMRRNLFKAIDEHLQKNSEDAFVTREELENLCSLESSSLGENLKFSISECALQGKRDSMEDAHFYEKTSNGHLVGVFDGHGGSSMAKLAQDKFIKYFFDKLAIDQNVRSAFELTIEAIHNEKIDVVKQLPPRFKSLLGGCTAVVCFIDIKNNLLYTATLGDSEANLYVTIDKKMKSIPLSCIRDWSSLKDILRVKKMEGYYINFPKRDQRSQAINSDMTVINSKELRIVKEQDPAATCFDLAGGGPNVSRAIGDYFYEAISQKPKITVIPLQPGTLVLACDGVKDYVTEAETIHIISQQTNVDKATELAHFALEQKNSSDNITVVAIDITAPQSEK